MAVERNDVGFNFEGDNRSPSLRELLHDQKLSATVLEEEEEESVPDDTLKNDDLNHERAGVSSVHSDQQGDSHNESVGECAEREDGDHPLQATVISQIRPQ